MDIKNFWKKHKTKVIIGSAIVGGVILVIIAKRNADKASDMMRRFGHLQGKDIIHWTPTNQTIKLERVKEILDANADNLAQFAIFKRGLTVDDYICVLTDARGCFIS